jgi:hypothetical protein
MKNVLSIDDSRSNNNRCGLRIPPVPLYSAAPCGVRMRLTAVIHSFIHSSDSPTHCANPTKAIVTEIGAACVKTDTSTYKYYWTMEVARP